MKMCRRKYIAYHKNGSRRRCAMTLHQAEASDAGMTLVEILVAMAIIVIVLAAIVPQIRAIRNSWDSKRENVEVIQNGRVLVDHITTQLAQANSIAAVSNSGVTNGYIQFVDNDGNEMRYEIDGSNYVVYGPVGNLSELAGPVSQLQFTCYDVCDLDTPIMDVNSIRTVKVQTTITNAAELGRDQTFIGQAYLRTNASGGGGTGQTVTEEPGSEFEFDTSYGEAAALCRIDATHHLCVYQAAGGATGQGWAVVLIVNTGNWTISKGTTWKFDIKACQSPALAAIDATNYLCAYVGDKTDSYAVILTVNPATWTITAGTKFKFDTAGGGPALSQIDSTNYLCAYRGNGSDGWAVILTVNTVTKTVTGGTLFRFETTAISSVPSVTLANIDNVHHLCAYQSSVTQGMAIVLTVNTVTRTVTKEGTAFQFESLQAMMNKVIKIDQTHYLCIYRGWGAKGRAFIFIVNTGTWAIGKGTTMQYDYDLVAQWPALAWISGNNYLIAYSGERPSEADIGKALVLTVDTQTDTVTEGPDFVYDNYQAVDHDLSRVDDSHYLCAYQGLSNDAFVTILTVGSPVLP